MDKEPPEKTIKEFEEIHPIYEGFTQKIEEVVKELLDSSAIIVHSVTSRTKNKKSLFDKILREGEKYQKLDDITDLSGIRIICWFLDQVPIVAGLIRKNFEVIDELSVDKSEIMDPDRFGYLSLHYIVRLSPDRKDLQEYKRYAGLYCEIQIRTILQHAWAEFEHDLGYRSQIGIPRDVKRRFYKLAGLLELADDEFQRLKNDIDKYSKIVKEKLEKEDKSLFIDKVSLRNYIERSEIINKIDKTILSFFEGGERLTDEAIKEEDLRILAFFNIKTIAELDQILKENQDDILKFAEKWIRPDSKAKSLAKGIAIFYLGYVLAGKTHDEEKIEKYTQIFPFAPEQKVAERIISLSKELF